MSTARTNAWEAMRPTSDRAADGEYDLLSLVAVYTERTARDDGGQRYGRTDGHAGDVVNDHARSRSSSS